MPVLWYIACSIRRNKQGSPGGLKILLNWASYFTRKYEKQRTITEKYFIVESSKKPKDGQKCRLSEKLFAARSSLGTRLSHLWSLTLIPKIFCYRLQLLYDCKGCPVLTKFSLTWSEVAKFALFE